MLAGTARERVRRRLRKSKEKEVINLLHCTAAAAVQELSWRTTGLARVGHMNATREASLDNLKGHLLRLFVARSQGAADRDNIVPDVGTELGPVPQSWVEEWDRQVRHLVCSLATDLTLPLVEVHDLLVVAGDHLGDESRGVGALHVGWLSDVTEA